MASVHIAEGKALRLTPFHAESFPSGAREVVLTSPAIKSAFLTMAMAGSDGVTRFTHAGARLQAYVSALRKLLGKRAITTRMSPGQGNRLGTHARYFLTTPTRFEWIEKPDKRADKRKAPAGSAGPLKTDKLAGVTVCKTSTRPGSQEQAKPDETGGGDAVG